VRKIALIFHFLGPYHWARLSAAAAQLDILAIELSARTTTYGWESVRGCANIERLTLFPGADSRNLPPAHVVTKLVAALDRSHPAVVVIPGWSEAPALAALEWGLRNHVPTVLMSESTAQDEPRRVLREAGKRKIVGLFSSALVGGAPHAEYAIQLGLPRDRVFIGYDAVDNHYFAENVAEIRSLKSEIRNRYGLSEHYFLASARFIEKKNLPRLLEAFARYRELASESGIGNRYSELWHLVLLGDGPLRSQIELRISELGLRTSVHLPGFKQYPDLPAYYGCASAFIHASTTEQWGLVVNEAMASGLPVLVSNRCGCAPDLVQDGVNGFTFDPSNVEEMANAMLRVWKREDGELQRMGDASRQIIANWGPERFAQGLKRAVNKALEVGSQKLGLVDRLLLKALMFR
jgi:1,2-diacylglycerol 3-alpha-glucosyltransferase